MESPPAKQARLEEDFAEFWQSIPNELRIKILRFLPTPDKFVYRRVSKEWKSLLDEKDIWIKTTRLTLGGSYWSTYQDGRLKLTLVENVFIDDEEEEDSKDKEAEHDGTDDLKDACKITALEEDKVQDDGVQEVQVDVGEESGAQEYDEEESQPSSEESKGAFFHNCTLIEDGLEWVLEVIQSAAPIRSLEIMDQEYRFGIDARDLMGLQFLVEQLEKSGTADLVSLVISNVHYCHLYDLFRTTITVNSLVEKQSQLERLIIGPFVEWSEFPDGPYVDSVGFFNYESYVQSGVVEFALPELRAVKDLEKLCVLVLYTCTIGDLNELSPSALNRLQVFIIVQFESDKFEEAEAYVREHAPSLQRRTDTDYSLVWTADETADVATLVKRKTDSVDFLARFAKFKKSEEAREAEVAAEIERENREAENANG